MKRNSSKKEPTTGKINPQSNQKPSKKPKVVLFEEYQCMSSWRMKPVTETTISRLAEAGIQWAITDERAIKINQFLQMNGIHRTQWERWKDNFPLLQKASDYMVMVLGNRRELGLLERKYEPGSTTYMMPHYDEDWHKIVEWRSSLVKKDSDSGKVTERYIVIPEIKVMDSDKETA
jgi:hypothetical protein